jgi:hypothetical protein
VRTPLRSATAALAMVVVLTDGLVSSKRYGTDSGSPFFVL